MSERATRTGSWTKLAFGDVVRQVKDRVDPEQSGLERYIAGEHMDTDDLRLRRWGEIGDGYLGPAFHMRFKPGQVLYGSRRTYLRKVAVADFEGITANTTYVLEPKDPNVLLPGLLPFIMQTTTFNQHSVRESKGSVNPYVNFSDLSWYQFALPPIEEQKRLTGALSAGAAACNAIMAAISRLIEIRESYAKVLWQDTNSSWPKIPLSDACLKIQDGTHFSPKSTDGPYLYVTSKNVRDGYLDISSAGRISRDEHKSIYQRCDVAPGDVLLTKDGANAGNVALNTLLEPFSLLSSVAMIRPNPLLLSASYLFEFLRSNVGRSQILTRVKGSAITRLTLEQIRGFAVPICDLQKQQQAVAILSAASSGIQRLSQRADQVRRLLDLLRAELECS